MLDMTETAVAELFEPDLVYTSVGKWENFFYELFHSTYFVGWIFLRFGGGHYKGITYYYDRLSGNKGICIDRSRYSGIC